MVNVVIYPRGNRWYARWWDAGQKCIQRRSLTTRDYRAAKRKARELAQDLEHGLPGRGVVVPLEPLAHRYLVHQKARVSKGWLVNQTKHLETFLERCPVKDAARISPAHVRDFLTRLHRSAGTTNRYRASLSGLFEFAIQDRLLRENPARKVGQRQETRRLIRFLPYHNVEAMMKAARATPLEVPLALGLYAGLRRGEICGLRWQDVDEANRLLEIRHSRTARGSLAPLKDREERHVPISEKLLEVLREARGSSPFVAVRHRKGWTPDALTRAVARFGEAHGIDGLNGPQILRSTFASRLVTAGERLGQVAAWLGDSIAVVEKHYARFAPGRRGKIDEV